MNNHTIPLNSLTNNRVNRKRVGRGVGSGTGRQCGMGHKGQCARSGVSVKGQLAKFVRRLPKRGFKSSKEKIDVISVNAILNQYSDSLPNLIDLSEVKLIGKLNKECKIHVKVKAISKGCKESIENAGGKVEIL